MVTHVQKRGQIREIYGDDGSNMNNKVEFEGSRSVSDCLTNHPKHRGNSGFFTDRYG